MDKHHDLEQLEAHGFFLKDVCHRGQLDGIQALLRFEPTRKLCIYRGCEGIYELRGQGRGRPKQHVLVDYEWFKPQWSIEECSDDDEWIDLVVGAAVSVEAAVATAVEYARMMFLDTAPKRESCCVSR